MTMGLNPSDLFDAGCQLSFLAVMALTWGVPALLPRTRALDPDDHGTPAARLDALERRLEGPWKAAGRRVRRKLVGLVVASIVVWAAAIPLVALRFHTVSPIGILLNLPLIPVTTRGAVLSRGSRSARRWCGDLSASRRVGSAACCCGGRWRW